jgi:hypothetical protein
LPPVPGGFGLPTGDLIRFSHVVVVFAL